MGFHSPRARPGGESAEEIAAERQDRAQARTRADLVGDRLEPARDTAVERVVLAILIVRLVGLAPDCAGGGDGEHRVTAAPIAATVCRVAIELEVRPARGERRPVREGAVPFEHRARAVRVNEREAALGEAVVGEEGAHDENAVLGGHANASGFTRA